MVLIIIAVLFLAFANGANDNFKGVATLFGSGTMRFKPALIYATVLTFAGSMTAFALAGALVRNFMGAGFVPTDLVGLPAWSGSVVAAAAITVLLATRLGMPVSTTHALTGALVGAGLAAIGTDLNFEKAGSSFALPLLVSPVLAVIATTAVYPVFRFVRLSLGINRESCVCIRSGEEVAWVPVSAVALDADAAGIFAPSADSFPRVAASREGCTDRYSGSVAGVSAQAILDAMHYLSAGAVSFARGLNDTPKIAAFLLLGAGLGLRNSVLATGVLIALGGWLAARRVAETVSHGITPMNAGQGVTANLVTSFLVIVASRWGLPVSTTHVSCGALFGIGAVTGEARWKMIAVILVAWVTTLPLAGVLAAVFYGIAINFA